MFKNVFALLEKIAFWVVYFAVCCLVYSVLTALLFGVVPTNGFVLLMDFFAINWCFFAGTLPLLYVGYQKIKNTLSNE